MKQLIITEVIPSAIVKTNNKAPVPAMNTNKVYLLFRNLFDKKYGVRIEAGIDGKK